MQEEGGGKGAGPVGFVETQGGDEGGFECVQARGLCLGGASRLGEESLHGALAGGIFESGVGRRLGMGFAR